MLKFKCKENLNVLLVILLLVTLVLGNIISVNAVQKDKGKITLNDEKLYNALVKTSKENWVEEIIDGEFKYFYNTSSDEKIYSAYGYDSNGVLVALTPTEIKNRLDLEKKQAIVMLKELDDLGSKSQEIIPYANWSYTLSGNGMWIAPKERVTNYLPKGTKVTTVWQITKSEGWDCGISLSASMKDAVKAKASFAWHSTATSATSISYEFPPIARDNGYIAFAPFFNETTGRITYNGNSYVVIADSPKKIGSLLDGTYYLM